MGISGRMVKINTRLLVNEDDESDHSKNTSRCIWLPIYSRPEMHPSVAVDHSIGCKRIYLEPQKYWEQLEMDSI